MGFLLGGYGTQSTGSGGGGGGITQIPVGNTYYVDATYGDDATALGNRFDLPFLTIDAALIAAMAGDMINIHAGVYTVSSNLLKDGVNYWCEEGVTISCSNFTLFNADTTTGGETLTVPFYFSGNAIINCSNSPIIDIKANPLAELTIELNSLEISKNATDGMVLGDGIVNLYIKKDFISVGRNFSMKDNGNLNAFIGGEVACTKADTSNSIVWSELATWGGSAYIKAKTFRLDTAVAGSKWTYIYIDNMQGCRLQVDLDYLYDFSANTTAMARLNNAGGSTSGNVILNINEIELSNRLLFGVTDAKVKLFINSDIVYDCAGAEIKNGIALIKIVNWQTHFSVSVLGGYLGLASSSLDSSSGGVGQPPIKLTGGLVGLAGTVLTSDSAESCLVNNGGAVKSFGSGGSGLIPSGSATPILIGEFECEGVRFQNTQNYTAGATVTVSNYISVLYINPAALVAALTINMPSNPVDNQEVILSFGGTITVGAVITALTLSGNTGQTILGAAGITTANSGDGYILKYQASTSIWRIL